ncbi:hypothetical protein HY405_00055 [Candidatus Microgenomates bacterium]|nr:hypothetical protein [Candidatus Microgenomates bacterium]
MMERRLVLKAGLLSSFIIAPLLEACVKESPPSPPPPPEPEIVVPPVPEIVIPKDESVVTIDTIPEKVTTDVGIETIKLLVLEQTGQTYVYARLSSDVRLLRGGMVVPRGPRNHGFVPFDTTFNVDEAVLQLAEHNKAKEPRHFRGDFMGVQLKFSQKMEHRIIETYDTPEVGRDMMYVMGFADQYTLRGEEPPIGLLKVKLQFI